MNTESTAPVFTKGPKRKKKDRVYEVDLLRGLPIFLVVLYHLCYDMTQLPYLLANYGEKIVDHPNLEGLIVFCRSILSNDVIHTYLVPFFAGMFLFACGVSTALSHNNLRRGFVLALWALLLSLATFVLSAMLGENLFIGWGILHIMAFSVLLYSLVELFSRKVLQREVHPLFCLLVGIVVYLFGLLLRSGIHTASGETYLWPWHYVDGNLTDWLAVSPLAYVYSALGIYGNYVDWWPIFPYLGVIFIGMAFGKALYGKRRESRFPCLRFPPLRPILFLGGHTIWVYLLHQPIAIAVLFVVLSSMGFHL